MTSVLDAVPLAPHNVSGKPFAWEDLLCYEHPITHFDFASEVSGAIPTTDVARTMVLQNMNTSVPHDKNSGSFGALGSVTHTDSKMLTDSNVSVAEIVSPIITETDVAKTIAMRNINSSVTHVSGHVPPPLAFPDFQSQMAEEDMQKGSGAE